MKKITRRVIATSLAAITTISAASVSFGVSAATEKVRLIVKNETYSVSDGAAWEGVLYDKTVDISDGKDALSTVTNALHDDNVSLTVNDTQWGSYIAAVNGISENDAAQYSGWMGVQNDWVVNNNLAYIFLRDGDTFELTYSVNIGADIGADWSNPTTALKALSIDGATINEEFTPSNTDYTVTVGDEIKNVFVLPTAENKNCEVVQLVLILSSIFPSVSLFTTVRHSRTSEGIAIGNVERHLDVYAVDPTIHLVIVVGIIVLTCDEAGQGQSD